MISNTLIEKCKRTIFLYQNRNSNLYKPKYLLEMKKELLNNIKELNEKIDENIINNSIKKPKKCYEVLLYSIIFKEDLVNHDVILLVLNNSEGKINPVSLILSMNKDLNDEIISKILTMKIDNGLRKPFDWRYHILKREEISDNLKQEVLNYYKEDEIEKIVDEIYNDLQDEFEDKGKHSLDSLKKYKNILKEHRAYTILKTYKDEINIKK